MALLNLNDTAQIGTYAGQASAGQSASIFHGGSRTLVQVFADPDLTITVPQPLVADDTGNFDLCYMVDGVYGVQIIDERENELLFIPQLNVKARRDRDYFQVFQSMASMLADTTLSYAASKGEIQVEPGDVLRAAKESSDLKVTAADDPNYHTETAGGLRLCVLGNKWHAAAFGVVADSDPTGTTGTDNGPHLTRLANALAARDDAMRVTFPHGVIRTSSVFNAESDIIADVQIYGDGTQILFTHPTSAINRRYFSVRNTATNGARCLINGLTLDLVRNPIRTGGSDMLSVGGFKDVDIFNNVIPSADNMAISIDRALITQASSVHIKNNRVGGKPPVTGNTHDYGAIGDTGIWVQHAGSGTLVTGNVIYGAGDDAIAIAETSVSPATAPAIISNNIARDVQGTAYKSAAAFTIFSNNYAENTVNDMYRIIDLSTQGGSTVPQGFQILGGYGKDIGTATAENLAVDQIITIANPCGVHIQSAAGNGTIIGLHLVNTLEEAVKVSTTDRDMSRLDVRSCVFDNIGVPGSAVFKREGSGSSYAVDQISFTENTIRNSQARLVAWECRLVGRTEGDLIWRNNQIINCDFSSNAEAFTFTGNQTENLEKIQISGDQWTNVNMPTTALLEIGDSDPNEFVFWIYEDGHLTALPLGPVRMRNNQNPGSIGLGPECRAKRGVRKTIGGSREMTDNVLMTLDPTKGWEVEVKGINNSSASLNTIFYSATWDPTFGRILHETQIGGGPAGDCNVELVEITPADPADQVFPGATEVLQVRGTQAGWTSNGSPFDPLINCQVTWRSVEDRQRPIKIT